MKIYFAPYRNHIRSRLLDTYKGGYLTDADTPFEKFLEKSDGVFQSILNLTINKWNQRPRNLKVKVHDYDVWGADHTLAMVIHPVLVRLKEKKKGSPHVDDSDVPEHLLSTFSTPKKNTWDLDDLFHARWTWVLDEMIWAFEQESDEYAGKQFWENSHYLEKEAEAWNARKLNGRRLFAKYYNNLWD